MLLSVSEFHWLQEERNPYALTWWWKKETSVSIGIQSQAFLLVTKRYRSALFSGHISLLRTNRGAQVSKKKETISERRACLLKAHEKLRAQEAIPSCSNV
jgi:hypothetical protein